MSATTKPIPAGTMNLSVNVTRDEWALLKRASVGFGSFGELLRALILAGAEVKLPDVAMEIEAVRLKYGRHLVATAMLCVGLLSIAESWMDGNDLRRAKGRMSCAKLVKKQVKRGTDVEGEA